MTRQNGWQGWQKVDMSYEMEKMQVEYERKHKDSITVTPIKEWTDGLEKVGKVLDAYERDQKNWGKKKSTDRCIVCGDAIGFELGDRCSRCICEK